MKYKMFDGNGAAVEAIRLVRPGVIAAYPITPQSSISEHLSDEVEAGRIQARYVRVESEHSAMSVCVGAQLTGLRAVTATSSVGLALMHEVVCTASGIRIPLVMPVVNRSLASPWSLWCDHSDTMAERDSGWLQYFAGSVQDVLDLYLCAIRISEQEHVLTPSMVCLDGFFLSHSMQKVKVPEDEEAYQFVGPYQRKNMFLDTKDPMFINDLTPTDDYGEMKYQQMAGFLAAEQITEETFAEYNQKFGSNLDTVREYCLEDAEIAVVVIGSMSGTAFYVVDELRKKGIKAGALQIVMFRPFPAKRVRKALQKIPAIGVVDRSAGLGGTMPPVCLEVNASLAGEKCQIFSYIGGLAGRDISDRSFRQIFQELSSFQEGNTDQYRQWFDIKEDPMNMRTTEKEEA